MMTAVLPFYQSVKIYQKQIILLQNSTLSISGKSKILLVISVAVILATIPLGIQQIDSDTQIYYSIHVVSVILGGFLVAVSFMSFSEFRSNRLLLVTLAFLAITIAEIISLVNMVVSLFDNVYGIHSLTTHGLILMMLAFFAMGIFRRD